MMVKDVTKLHKCHLGVGICLNMYVVCAGFTQDFEFRKGGELQSSVLMWRGCIARNN